MTTYGKQTPKTPEEKREYQATLWQRPEGATFDVAHIRDLLREKPWEEADHNVDADGQERRVWLGTVFGVTPSGKVYAPFACSNVWGCASCGGSGIVLHVKRRTFKKWQRAHERARALWQKRGRHWAIGQRHPSALRSAQVAFRNHQASHSTCRACGGLGSREAFLDELWREHHEKLFEDWGIGFECGDNGDYFAVEYRDTPDEDEEDEEEESNDA